MFTVEGEESVGLWRGGGGGTGPFTCVWGGGRHVWKEEGEGGRELEGRRESPS